MMVSTLYSSLDPIISGGSVEKLGPCVSVCLKGDSREVWKTSWTFHVGGNRRQYMIGDRTWEISNGPWRLGASFLLGYCRRRLVASSHTLSPTFHGEKVLVRHSLMIRRAVSWAAKASFLALSKVFRQFSSAGRKVFPIEG